MLAQPVLTRGDSDGLDVGDGRRASEQPDISGERRLEPGLALFPLDRLDQGRLLSTDVRSGTPVQVNVEIVPGPTGVLADQARLVGLVDGLLDVGGFLVEFSSNVDVGCRGRGTEVSRHPSSSDKYLKDRLRLTGTSVHSSPSYQTPFDELVRVSPHDLPVLAGTRLSLVGVDYEVSRPVMVAAKSIGIVDVEDR